MSVLEDRIAQLSPEKRKLLEARLRQQAENSPPKQTRPPTTRQPAETLFDDGAVRKTQAHPAQQRLWIVDQMTGAMPVYNTPQIVRFRGPLDVSALQEAIADIVRRHETLRTHFELDRSLGDQPYAVISPKFDFEIPIVDLSQIAIGHREEEAKSIALTFAKQTFDLKKAPLFRTKLLRLSDHEHLLIWVVHHIISDRWSTGVFYGDLAVLYTARRNNQPNPLPPLKSSYSKYTQLQQSQSSSARTQQNLKYWRELLADSPKPLELPADHARPPMPTFRGAALEFSIPAPTVSAINNLARENGCTPYMAFLAALDVLLHRMTNQTDILIGTLMAGRGQLDSERLIGLFINALPVRMTIDPNQKFHDFLNSVKSRILDLFAHQDIAFDQLLNDLRIERDVSRPPVFGIAFNFQNTPYSPNWPAELQVEMNGIDLGIAKYDLMLTTRPGKNGELSCEFEYSLDLFNPATIERLAEHWRVLLDAIATDPSQPIYKLAISTEQQRHQILNNWSASTPPRENIKVCVHQLFERQVLLTPKADALVFQNERLTYEQLNQKANQLAWHLRSLGIGPDSLVAICLKRTTALPIAVLAVLKAGGAYVPLDPAYPHERLAYMLEDSKAKVLLTESELVRLFPSDSQRAVVCLEDATATLAQQSMQNPPAVSGLNNLAYVIYTSGSTGRPKGVAIEHRGPAALIEWARREIPDEQIAGMLFSTSVCFDLSVFEFWVPWSRGGKLILVQNALELPTCPAANEVTFINTVPSAMAELIATSGVPKNVNAIGLCGEALQLSLAKQCRQIPGIKSVYNFYGPTEDTVYSTVYIVPPEINSTPPIGRPIAGTSAYILDSHMQPVPPGVDGELYLGGSKLARGYFNRPELTAERFVPNPFGSPGERLYRTGDLCRWAADGTILFFGRLDHQIKLRGFRIELGEIESVLGKISGVRQCIVIVTGNQANQNLVAYLTADSASDVSPSTLRAALSAHLPAYMIPSAFMRLDAMPLTPNGKIDRKLLPAFQRSDAAPKRGPASEVERDLLQIWQQLLGTAQSPADQSHADLSRTNDALRPSIDIGMDDSFFELGGHSLLGLRLMHLIKQKFGREIPLTRLFLGPTIAQLAQAIRTSEDSTGTQLIVPLRTEGSRPPLFLFPGSGGHGFTFLPLSRLMNPDQPVYGAELHDVMKENDRPRSVEEIAMIFLDQLRQIRPKGPYRLGGYSFGGIVAYEIAMRLIQAGEQVDALVLFDTYAPNWRQQTPMPRRLIANTIRYFANSKNRKMSRLFGWAGEPNAQQLSDYNYDLRQLGFIAYANYHPAQFNGTLTLLRANNRPAWQKYMDHNEDVGWQKYVTGRINIHPVPTSHLALFDEPTLQFVAHEVETALAKLPGDK